MGSMYLANCECGFTKNTRVGGGMKDHKTDSSFPFYCDYCGLVSVNISQDQLACPYCESKDVIQYGDAKISEPADGYKSVHWGNYSCANSGHLCPSCKNKTMRFTLEMLFD